MTGPNLLAGAPTALEIIADIVQNSTVPPLVFEQNLFFGYANTDDTATFLVYQVLDATSSPSLFTFGTVVATERQSIDVILYGAPGDFKTPRDEAMRLRYLILSKNDYVFNGLRMLHADARGNVQSLGRDAIRRANFMISFDVALDPSYDRSFDA